jgi:hypothetical protein
VTSVLISALKEAEIYVIKVYAVSSAGIGEPAFIEILTPRILPCGSDKDPGVFSIFFYKAVKSLQKLCL